LTEKWPTASTPAASPHTVPSSTHRSSDLLRTPHFLSLHTFHLTHPHAITKTRNHSKLLYCIGPSTLFLTIRLTIKASTWFRLYSSSRTNSGNPRLPNLINFLRRSPTPFGHQDDLIRRFPKERPNSNVPFEFGRQKRIVNLEHVLTERQNGGGPSRRGTFSQSKIVRLASPQRFDS